MVSRFPALAAVLAALTALPASGQGLGFSAEGTVGIGLRGDRSGTTLNLFGDADATLTLVGPLALRLGLYGLGTDLTGDQDTPHETYGTLVWKFSGAELSIGVPRPAYDAHLRSTLERLDPVRAMGSDMTAATRSQATWGAIHDGALPWGASVTGKVDGLDWAVSVHRYDDTINLASVSTEWRSQYFVLATALEASSDGDIGGKLGMRSDFGMVEFGAAGFVSPTPGAPDLAEVDMTLHLQNGVDLTALIQGRRHPDGRILALGAEWDVTPDTRLVGTLSRTGGKAALFLGGSWSFGKSDARN